MTDTERALSELVEAVAEYLRTPPRADEYLYQRASLLGALAEARMVLEDEADTRERWALEKGE